jgi:predicted small secreted protein
MASLQASDLVIAYNVGKILKNVKIYTSKQEVALTDDVDILDVLLEQTSSNATVHIKNVAIGKTSIPVSDIRVEVEGNVNRVVTFKDENQVKEIQTKLADSINQNPNGKIKMIFKEAERKVEVYYNDQLISEGRLISLNPVNLVSKGTAVKEFAQEFDFSEQQLNKGSGIVAIKKEDQSVILVFDDGEEVKVDRTIFEFMKPIITAVKQEQEQTGNQNNTISNRGKGAIIVGVFKVVITNLFRVLRAVITNKFLLVFLLGVGLGIILVKFVIPYITSIEGVDQVLGKVSSTFKSIISHLGIGKGIEETTTSATTDVIRGQQSMQLTPPADTTTQTSQVSGSAILPRIAIGAGIGLVIAFAIRKLLNSKNNLKQESIEQIVEKEYTVPSAVIPDFNTVVSSNPNLALVISVLCLYSILWIGYYILDKFGQGFLSGILSILSILSFIGFMVIIAYAMSGGKLDTTNTILAIAKTGYQVVKFIFSGVAYLFQHFGQLPGLIQFIAIFSTGVFLLVAFTRIRSMLTGGNAITMVNRVRQGPTVQDAALAYRAA